MAFLEQRKSRRVSDAMALRVESKKDAIAPLDSTPTHVVNISNSGIRFLHESKLNEQELLAVTMRLGPEKKTVTLMTEVVSSHETTNLSGARCYNAQLKFFDLDNTTLNLLDQHINHVLHQTYKHCREYPFKATA